MIVMQSLPPGSHRLHYCGDLLVIRLTVTDADSALRGYVRTNLGRGARRRRELVERVESGVPLAHAEWHDVAMAEVTPGIFEVRIPLAEPGFFQAKSFVLSDGKDDPLWPDGDNVYLHVQPAGFAAHNTLYNAFVRQFGPSLSSPLDAACERSARALEEAGYTAIPPSGTFRDLIPQLDTIMERMGFRLIQLLPIFPTPTVYARMGRFGSPFAATDFFQPDPALAEFDRRSTPLDQFRELTDAIHARGGRVILDIPLNHTGWGSRLQTHHPEWFKRNEDGSFRSPGAWGITWEDLTELEYGDRELWQSIAEVLLFWCGEGVDGFRCDAGYMLPVPVWEYLTSKLRLQYPETLFFLEGLGGKLSSTEALLGRGGMNWAYSELFQTPDRAAMDDYLPYAGNVSAQRGLLLHFAETHDNKRLAASGHGYARMRTALAALCSTNGAFGITAGVEWFAEEKLDVHGAASLNWGAEPNMVAALRRLNNLLAQHPCFHPGTALSLVHSGEDGNAIALLRSLGDERLLILVNLDAKTRQRVSWPADSLPGGSASYIDVLSGETPELRPSGSRIERDLDPGEIRALSRDGGFASRLAETTGSLLTACEHLIHQRLRALAAAVYTGLWPEQGIEEDLDSLAAGLARSPEDSLRALTDRQPQAGVVRWQQGQDETRQVMVPAGHFLLVTAPSPFRVRLQRDREVQCHADSLPCDSGAIHFAILMPPAAASEFAECQLTIRCYVDKTLQSSAGPLLLLPPPERPGVCLYGSGAAVSEQGLAAICANERGSMVQVNGEWGGLESVYDCLLAGNPDPRVPMDRHIMLTRLRGWAVIRGYSTELNSESLRSFGQDPDGTLLWCFHFPAADGCTVTLHVRLQLCEQRNQIEIQLARLPANGENDLADDAPLRLILRPDLEDRSSHGVTKASEGPEDSWPDALTPAEGGFVFQPAAERRLRVGLEGGEFVSEPEWLYAVPHPVEASRGLEHLSDLFSPGYLHTELQGGDQRRLIADQEAEEAGEEQVQTAAEIAEDCETDVAPASPLDSLRHSMDRFVVRRGEHRTVIAGYPWFLDWGRDTLICLRGLIAAGRLEESRDILIQFARFEEQGTIPNMIRGSDASNRDTSDAPLWLFVAVKELLEAESSRAFLDEDVGGRSIRQVLASIGRHLLRGTPNGIAADSATALLFSPAHFTWMDTNYPAGSPREGYPIEIQALWYAALDLLARIDESGDDWASLRDKVQAAIPRLFYRPDPGCFSDCLHGTPGTSADTALADDHIRPNQLFALTLGAVRDPAQAAGTLAVCEQLLVPGAIRSLAERPVEVELPVRGKNGLLNDPRHPYWGRYEGDEDSRRKPAYHNGTAWTWPFPSYCEALFQWGGENARFTAHSLLISCLYLMNRGCIAQLPEVIDGDAPHTFRGCGAQAWGVTEFYRVLKRLTPATK